MDPSLFKMNFLYTKNTKETEATFLNTENQRIKGDFSLKVFYAKIIQCFGKSQDILGGLVQGSKACTYLFISPLFSSRGLQKFQCSEPSQRDGANRKDLVKNVLLQRLLFFFPSSFLNTLLQEKEKPGLAEYALFHDNFQHFPIFANGTSQLWHCFLSVFRWSA